MANEKPEYSNDTLSLWRWQKKKIRDKKVQKQFSCSSASELVRKAIDNLLGKK